MSRDIQKDVLLFSKFLSYLVCVESSMTINGSPLSSEKYCGRNFTLAITRSKYVGGNRVD